MHYVLSGGGTWMPGNLSLLCVIFTSSGCFWECFLVNVLMKFIDAEMLNVFWLIKLISFLNLNNSKSMNFDEFPRAVRVFVVEFLDLFVFYYYFIWFETWICKLLEILLYILNIDIYPSDMIESENLGIMQIKDNSTSSFCIKKLGRTHAKK